MAMDMEAWQAPFTGLDPGVFLAKMAHMTSPYAMNTALDVVMFVFWFRFWNANNRDIFFNPYLGFLARPTDWVMKTLGLAARRVSPRFVAGVVFLLLVMLRAWLGRMKGSDRVEDALLGVLFGFSVAVFKLWAVGLLYLGPRPAASLNRTEITVFRLCAPWTRVTGWARILVLLLVGVGLMGMQHHASLEAAGQSIRSEWALGFLVLQAMILWVKSLELVSSLMILFVIGSWISLLTHSRDLGDICNEWIAFLLGPLRDRPIRIGTFDLTPIILVVGMNLFIWVALDVLNVIRVFMDRLIT